LVNDCISAEVIFMSGELALIDSNLLTYLFDASEPDKQKICRELIGDCWLGKRKYAVSVQNLSEFYVTVTNKIENPIPKRIAERFISLITEFRNWKVIDFDANTVRSAIRVNMEYGVHYWDALLAATMKEHLIFSICTEDSDFLKIPWLTVLNPME
jgi:predicted nucleic acid-binding protein